MCRETSAGLRFCTKMAFLAASAPARKAAEGGVEVAEEVAVTDEEDWLIVGAWNLKFLVGYFFKLEKCEIGWRPGIPSAPR